MLPAPKTDALSLADVLQSSFHSLSGRPNRLALGPADGAIVLLVDGLGADALKARAGHARTLAGALTPRSVIQSGFPTTTAAAIATLTTGVLPGQHGLVGYTVLDAANDRVVNQLSGWDDKLDPYTWQLAPTLFETASAQGFPATVIAAGRYSDSGFSQAVLRGAVFVPGESIADRMDLAAVTARDGGLVYVYVPELDMAAHAHGGQSAQWTSALETTDAAVRELVASLGRRTGLLVTADHGVLDIPRHAHVLFDEDPELVDGVRFVAGEPRAIQLHFEPDASPRERERIVAAWRESESDRAWVATREEAIGAGWFGEVRPEVATRIGDLIVAARKGIAYYDSRAGTHGRSMIGQHGSMSPTETRVPLLRYGAFAER